jgi:hypothetical protein
MTLIIQKPTGAKLVLRKELPADAEADAYIAAVEAADGQSLESGVKFAIKNFVLCCKDDGIWPAIKASCILAGARTLAGALVPLAGTAPTNVGPFVSGDYNRKTGLVGNATTKYLNSNRNNNADPQNNRHLSVWISTAATATAFGGDIGVYSVGGGSSYIGRANAAASLGSSSGLTTSTGLASTVTAFRGVSRAASGSFIYRASSANNTIAVGSITPFNSNVEVFRGGNSSLLSNARIAFYSIGESLDLALLDARVTDLINAFAAAIP